MENKSGTRHLINAILIKDSGLEEVIFGFKGGRVDTPGEIHMFIIKVDCK